MESKKISVVIVNFKNKESVFSIRDACMGDPTVLEVIIIDNSGEIDNKKVENSGFAAACNRGAARVKGKYLAFINPDIVLEKNVLQTLLAHKNDAAVIAPVLTDLDGTFQKNAGYFPKWSWKFWKRLNMNPIHISHKPNGLQKVDWITGGFFIIDKQIFDELGGFDEKYFMYWEDIDLSLRLLQKKYSLFLDGSVVVKHAAHSSVNQVSSDVKNAWYKKSQNHFRTTYSYSFWR